MRARLYQLLDRRRDDAVGDDVADELGTVGHIGEIEQLAGCDRLTIGPNFLEDLSNDQAPLSRKLYPDMSQQDDLERLQLDEKTFRLLLNDDAMATDKLAEGIRNFSADLIKLENFIKERMAG